MDDRDELWDDWKKYWDRRTLAAGQRFYFAGISQWDGFPTLKQALVLTFSGPDNACLALDETVEINVRTLVGLYQYEAEFLSDQPRAYGLGQLKSWKWLEKPPHFVDWFERINPDTGGCLTHNSGPDIGKLIKGHQHEGSGTACGTVAAWATTSRILYKCTLTHVETVLRSQELTRHLATVTDAA